MATRLSAICCGARLRQAHLPQGGPTSPALANLVCFHLDARLSGYAKEADAHYTRYADDLTFSGSAALRRHAAPFVRGVGTIVADEGFALNPAKTRVEGRGDRQQVTGIVVTNNSVSPGGSMTGYARSCTMHTNTVHNVPTDSVTHSFVSI